MRIYTKAGDLAFKTFPFPDGQPHFKLETYEREFNSVTIEMALRSPSELFTLSMAVHVLRAQGYAEVNVDIRYLLGARMDRAIDPSQPHTLELVAKQLNALGLSRVRILDVHSEVATRLIRNSENVLPVNQVEQVIAKYPHCSIVIPDKGAEDRVMKVSRGPMGYVRNVIRCGKTRDLTTGQLSGFKILDGNPYGTNLIIDDICDGGGTFIGLAKELRKYGASKIYLYVTHGVFSKGLPLEGIDQVYTTDSYNGPVQDDHILGGRYLNFTVIPISMKEMK